MEVANEEVDYKYNFWLKTIKKIPFPKIIHGSAHMYKDNNIIIMHFNTGKPIAMIIDA